MTDPATLTLLTLNVQSPSADRAEKQLRWLADRPEDVFVLTETKDSAGCRLLADRFAALGYHVHYRVPDGKDYGTMIISRLPAQPNGFGDRLGYLPARAAAITLTTATGPVDVIGAYVPSRDATPAKTERKRKWLHACLTALAADPDRPRIFLGDLNVLEPGHQPHYRFFSEFEYDFYRRLTAECGLLDAFRHLHPDLIEHSWVGRTGDGYRYDHLHLSTDLVPTLIDCDYLHQPRIDRLTDHSGVTARLAIDAGARLITSQTASSDTLF